MVTLGLLVTCRLWLEEVGHWGHAIGVYILILVKGSLSASDSPEPLSSPHTSVMMFCLISGPKQWKHTAFYSMLTIKLNFQRSLTS